MRLHSTAIPLSHVITETADASPLGLDSRSMDFHVTLGRLPRSAQSQIGVPVFLANSSFARSAQASNAASSLAWTSSLGSLSNAALSPMPVASFTLVQSPSG